jgi:Glycosyl hydrolase family 3 C terminal domain.
MQLAQAVHEAGKPMIVVLLNGRPLTINWIDRNASAVVEAWFQGEFCGTAIADVLFGDVNPSGKLPITFPKTVGQIPYNFPFKRGSQPRTEDLNAQEKRTLVNGALYPFGYGLSYTSYRYSNLEVAGSPASRDRNDSCRVGCRKHRPPCRRRDRPAVRVTSRHQRCLLRQGTAWSSNASASTG